MQRKTVVSPILFCEVCCPSLSGPIKLITKLTLVAVSNLHKINCYEFIKFKGYSNILYKINCFGFLIFDIWYFIVIYIYIVSSFFRENSWQMKRIKFKINYSTYFNIVDLPIVMYNVSTNELRKNITITTKRTMVLFNSKQWSLIRYWNEAIGDFKDFNVLESCETSSSFWKHFKFIIL